MPVPASNPRKGLRIPKQVKEHEAVLPGVIFRGTLQQESLIRICSQDAADAGRWHESVFPVLRMPHNAAYEPSP